MKKLLSLVLSLLMVFSVLPAFAMTASAEYAEDTVAVIGGDEYSSLFGEDGALLSASEGDTVVLVKDVKEKGGITLDKAIILDLAGFEIINYSTARVITTSADLTIRSTVDGLGETNTDAKANYRYSGVLVTSSADVTFDNVNFYEAVNFPEYDEDANLCNLENATWEHMRYRYQNNYWGLGTYDNYTRTANTTLIPVKPSTTYYFTCDETTTDTFGMEVFAYKVLEASDAHPDTAVKVPDGNEVAITGSMGTVTNGVLTTGANTAYIGINVYCSNNEWGYNNSRDKIMPLLKDGRISPRIYEVIDLCGRDTSVGNNLVDVTADNTTLTIKDTILDRTACNHSTAGVMNFTKATTFDVADTTFKFHNANGGTELTINNAGAKGTFKNTTFSGNNAHGIKITNADTTDGLTFENCTVTSSGDGGKTPFAVAGGLVNIIGGSFGNKNASNNTSFDGGKIIVNGTTFNSAKAGNALKLAAAADVEIKKATFVKSTTTINDKDLFLAALAEGAALYSSTEKTVKTILARSKDLNSLDTFYVDDCMHYCAATQEGSTVCEYCLSDTTIEHDYSEIKYDETQHWYVCARCDEVGPKTDHAVGDKGKKATCTTKPVCGVCEQEYDKALGHSFTDYQPVSTDVAGCEHNPVTKAICDNGCGEEAYDYSALTNLEVTKVAVEPTCTEKGATAERSCITCKKVIEPSVELPANGHDYGEEQVVKAATYRTTGSAYKVCQVDDCGFKYEYELPMLDYAAKVSAVIGEDGAKQFDSLKAAIDAAEDGDVIVVVKNLEEEFATNLSGKSITIDLAGHSLAISTSAAAAITTDSDITIRSTDGGWGLVDSGVVPVLPADPNAQYYTVADVSNPDNWRVGEYEYQAGAYKETAGRACLKKLVDVDTSKTYEVTSGTTDTNNQVIIREYDANGKFTKSIGALVNGTQYTPNAGTRYISVSIYNSTNGSVDFVNKIASGSVNPSLKMVASKAPISYSKPFVAGSGKFEISNIKGIAGANTSLFTSNATDVTAPAEWKATNCEFTLLDTNANAAPINFTSGALKVDFEDVAVQSGKLGDGVTLNSQVFGTFKNTKFKKNQGSAISVKNTAPEGIVLDGCQVTQSAYDTNVSTFSGGKTTLTGGTVFNGNNVSTSVIYITGGTLIMDGVELRGDKGSDSGRVLLSIGADGLDIQIKKATFIRGTANGANGLVCNNDARFKAALVSEHCAYYADVNGVPNCEYAYFATTNLTTAKVVYIDKCEHESETSCLEGAECVYCGTAFEPMGHSFAEGKFNYRADDENHWKACVRCGIADESSVEAHALGTSATCGKQDVCSICNLGYGEVLAHDWDEEGYVNDNNATCTENATETTTCKRDGCEELYSREIENSYLGHECDIIEHNSTEHWFKCSREGCDYTEGNEEHKGGKATCDKKANCSVCQVGYGEVLGHDWDEEGYVNDNNATCTENATETTTCKRDGCSETKSREVPNTALKHVIVIDPEIPASCEDVGYTAGSHCSRCKESIENQKVIPAFGYHTWDDGAITQGTCCKKGAITYTCTFCGKKDSVATSLNASVHTVVTKPTVKATYFKAGKYGDKYCKDCGKIISIGKTIKKKVLKAPKLSVKAGKKTLTVKYKKVTGATGFQVRYKKAGAKKWTTKTVWTKKAKKKVLSKLSSGAKYSVQIRAAVKSGKNKAYSKWSKAKSYKVK